LNLAKKEIGTNLSNFLVTKELAEIVGACIFGLVDQTFRKARQMMATKWQ
jgi:hypothetical protein